MSKTPKVSKGSPASGEGAQAHAPQSDQAQNVPASADSPRQTAAAGTHSTDDASGPRAESGAGDTAGPAGFLGQMEEALKAEQDAFRKAYPIFSAAIDAWVAKSSQPPSGLRISSKYEGFRRAGMAHPKEAVDHPLETFADPKLVEQLFAEPHLVVQLI